MAGLEVVDVSKGQAGPIGVVASAIDGLEEQPDMVAAVEPQGGIAERGKHADLLETGGLYAQMWSRQREATEAEERLKRAEAVEQVRTGTTQTGTDDNYRLGNRVLAELLGGLIGGALFGWLIDRIAGTSPWGLLGMLFMGIVVAFRNIIRPRISAEMRA